MTTIKLTKTYPKEAGYYIVEIDDIWKRPFLIRVDREIWHDGSTLGVACDSFIESMKRFKKIYRGKVKFSKKLEFVYET